MHMVAVSDGVKLVCHVARYTFHMIDNLPGEGGHERNGGRDKSGKCTYLALCDYRMLKIVSDARGGESSESQSLSLSMGVHIADIIGED